MPANLPGKLLRGHLMYIHSGRGRRHGFGKKNSGASEHGFTHVLKYQRPGKQAPVLFGAAGYPSPYRTQFQGRGGLGLLKGLVEEGQSSFMPGLEEGKQASDRLSLAYHLH